MTDSADTVLRLVQPESRQNSAVIDILRGMLDQAEKGELSEVMVFARTPGGYTVAFTHTLTPLERLGAFEMVRHDWLMALRTRE